VPDVQKALLAWVLTACASGPAPTPAAPTPAPPGPAAAAPRAGVPRVAPPLAVPGEHMHYRLSLQGIELATYQLAIGAPTELAGKPAVVVQSHAKVNGIAAYLATIDDHFTSWLDPATGRTLRFTVDEYATGSKTDIEHVVVDFAARGADTIPVTFRLGDAPEKPEPQHTAEPEVWDVNAFLVALRSWEGPPGSALSLEVFRSRYLWRCDVTIRGKERHATELGDLPALRIEGRTRKLDRKGAPDRESSPRAFTIWISDDEARVPLEIKAVTDYGDLRMQIVDYQPGPGRGD